MTQLSELERAHKHCTKHRNEIASSDLCGCFCCLAVFPPAEIRNWTDWPGGTPKELEVDLGETALCPRCAVDSVLGSASGFPLTPEFLGRMRQHWFQTL